MYCQISDIKQLLSGETLERLTLGDESLIVNAITKADELVDGYLARFAADIKTASLLIKTLSEKITVYNLFSYQGTMQIPDAYRQDYNSSISTLRSIASGNISLGSAGDTTGSSFGVKVVTSSKLDMSGY